jgi:hypothetical protein
MMIIFLACLLKRQCVDIKGYAKTYKQDKILSYAKEYIDNRKIITYKKCIKCTTCAHCTVCTIDNKCDDCQKCHKCKECVMCMTCDYTKYFRIISNVYECITNKQSKYTKILNNVKLETDTDNFIKCIDNKTAFSIGMIIKNYEELSHNGFTIEKFNELLKEEYNSMTIENLNKLALKITDINPIILHAISRTNPTIISREFELSIDNTINQIDNYEIFLRKFFSENNKSDAPIVVWFFNALTLQCNLPIDRIDESVKYSTYVHFFRSLWKNNKNLRWCPNKFIKRFDEQFIKSITQQF